MLDFTSALYLGMWHGSESLRGWDRLTLGAPAALKSLPECPPLERLMAELQGSEAAVLGPSTFHLVWDMFGMLARNAAVYMDSGSYPILWWGAERAKSRSTPVHSFNHYDVTSLRKMIATHGRKPFIAVNGFCPDCGRHAPIREFLACLDEFGGTLFIDDTQAFGILGRHDGDCGYGTGGGGTAQWLGISDQRILTVASCAKGFGVPVACLFGSREFIAEFTNNSATRLHCSPPSRATLRALEHALMVNVREGDLLRQALMERVSLFRRSLSTAGIKLVGSLFPVQTLISVPSSKAEAAYEYLLSRRIHSVLLGHDDSSRRLSFLITVRHSPEDIQRLADELTVALQLQDESRLATMEVNP